MGRLRIWQFTVQGQLPADARSKLDPCLIQQAIKSMDALPALVRQIGNAGVLRIAGKEGLARPWCEFPKAGIEDGTQILDLAVSGSFSSEYFQQFVGKNQPVATAGLAESQDLEIPDAHRPRQEWAARIVILEFLPQLQTGFLHEVVQILGVWMKMMEVVPQILLALQDLAEESAGAVVWIFWSHR